MLFRLAHGHGTELPGPASDLEFASSVPFGGTYVLDHLWCRLKADKIAGQDS